MLKLVTDFCRDEEGATAIEYGLIAALVSVAAITAFFQVGQHVKALFISVSDSLGTVAENLPK
jgi:pilus assembly protein Flp/PilA